MGLAVLACVSSASFAGVSGYLDGQFHVDKNAADFRIYDGSVFASKELGNGLGYVNLPFSGGLATNSFSLATVKAEAYASYKYDFGVKWTLGQFATPFGYEGNNTWGLRFSEYSLLKNAMPLTHTGFMAGYTSGSIEIKGLISNPINKGTRVGTNFEAGGLVRYTHDALWVQGGFLGFSTGGEMQTLINATFGGKWDKLGVDIDFLMTKLPVAGAETGIGFQGNLGYDINSSWAAGLRAEFLSKVANLYTTGALAALGITTGTVFAVTAGPQAKLTDDMKVKLDFTMMSSKATSGASSTTSTMGTLAALYKF